jgi:opacity protein-like surface antigen
MKTCLVAIATLVLFSIPAIGSAAPARPGPYFSVFLGGSFAKDVTVSGYDYFSNIPYNDKVSFDSGIYTGGTGGYDFGFMRLEGEMSYRYANIDSITFSSGEKFNNTDGDVGVFATMLNVYFDVHNSTPVTPYLGGGAGFASLYIGDTYGCGTQGCGQLYGYSTETVFAAQVGAGVDIALNNSYSLDLGYRYFITEKAHLNSYIGSNEFEFESHNVLVGFKMKF